MRYFHQVSVGFVLSTVGVLILGAFVAQAQTDEPAGGIRGLNNQVLRLHGEMQRGDARTAVELRRQASAAIAQRAAEMSALIEKDPAQALSMAFSADLLADLAARFPEAAEQLETQGTWQGTAEHWIEDYPDGTSRSVVKLKSDGQNIEVHFAGPEPADCEKGGILQVSGVRLANKVAGSSGKLEALASTAVAGATTSTCGTTGPQNTVVLMVTFPGVNPPSYTTSQSVYNAFWGTSNYNLNGYWQEASYGKTSAVGNAYGWYTLSQTYTCSTIDSLRTEALNQAFNAGVVFQNNTRLFIVVPDMGCGWSGATGGICQSFTSPSGSFTASTSYIDWGVWGNGSGTNNAAQIIFHEGGHNLGLNHSRSRGFGADAVGPMSTLGTIGEYGDGFTAMTNGGAGHYDAPQKAELLGWLSNYQVVQNSGTWTIAPLEPILTGLQALKIQRGTGNNAWLWVEYRQPIGYDNSFNTGNTWSTNIYSGATIHYEDLNTTYQYSDLLDFSPNDSYQFYTPDLMAGQTWVDPYSNVSITVNSATASGLNVSVSYGSTPCTHTNPTVAMSPANPSISAGSSAGYTVSVTNNDSSGCSAGTFNLSSTQPTGWLGVFSASSLFINPGQAASATLTETVPLSTLSGTYAVNVSVTNSTYTGSATANATVVTAPSLTDATSVPSSSYSTRQTVPVTATIMNGSIAAPGASVTFNLTKANGSKVTGTVTTDATGKASWSYKLGPKDSTGSYSVMNTAKYNSNVVTSNTVNFTVQ